MSKRARIAATACLLIGFCFFGILLGKFDVPRSQAVWLSVAAAVAAAPGVILLAGSKS
jgi:hypothetical protein